MAEAQVQGATKPVAGSTSGSFIKPFFTFFVIVAVMVAGYFIWKIKVGGTVAKDKYQAVFLTNGQVYFGKIASLNSDYPTLTDIYYLLIRPPLQSQQPEATPAAQTPSYTLIKLGNEVHGPVDRMVINRRHILFVEDLRDDGRVVQAIMQAKQQSAPVQQQQQQQQQEKQVPQPGGGQ